MQLEVIEAGDDDDGVNAACDRDYARTGKLLEKLQKTKVVSDGEVYELLSLSKTLLEKISLGFSHQNADALGVILKMATNALHDRKLKQAA